MTAALLGSAVLAALGLLLWAQAWRHWRQRAVMLRWPVAQALVRDYRTRVSRGGRMVDVAVSYRHEQRDHAVWVTSPTGAGYGRGDVQAERQVAARFPRGSTHAVFVNPERADEAFLERPEPHLLAILAGSGAVLVALAVTLGLQAAGGWNQELVTLVFMAFVALVLSVLVVVLGVALVRTPRRRGRR